MVDRSTGDGSRVEGAGKIPRRRRVDWGVIFEGRIPSPRPLRLTEPRQLSTLVAAAMSACSAAAADRVLRSAVELCRLVFQMERTAIFLLDQENGAMVGTWGTDGRGRTVDEHHIMYEFGPSDRALFERARRGQLWTVYDNLPLVTQLKDETRVVGRGWVAVTAILGPHGPVGTLFNDTALSHAPVDESKQARAALLCSLLGQALDGRRRATAGSPVRPQRTHPLVAEVTRALAADPTLSCEALAKRVHLSTGRLARIFKRETRTSLVEHRNDLRLARFLDGAYPRAGSLLEAALDAGFGSYAQFHRVFRARYGAAPGAYLSALEASEWPTGNERAGGRG